MRSQARVTGEPYFGDDPMRSELPPGGLVVERYVYTTRRGREGVQWLAQVVDKEGVLRLARVCKTRREALAVFDA